jgi:hypothetical protein
METSPKQQSSDCQAETFAGKPAKPGLLLLGCPIIALAAVVASCANSADSNHEARDQAGTTEVLREALTGGGTFGTHSAVDYQNNWQVTLTGSDTAVSGMNSTLGSTNFWFNLVGKQYYWYEAGDHDPLSLDTVDMFVEFTHGGITATDAEWAMWDQPVIAYSSQMRLGDDDVGMSIFTQVSCATLTADANTWTRWSPVFKGGLRIALGSGGLFFWDSGKFDVLKVFAEYLNAGNTFKTSWPAGWMVNDSHDADVAIMTTGATSDGGSSDCATRRDNMTWGNFASYPRLQDESASYWCGWAWASL